MENHSVSVLEIGDKEFLCVKKGNDILRVFNNDEYMKAVEYCDSLQDKPLTTFGWANIDNIEYLVVADSRGTTMTPQELSQVHTAHSPYNMEKILYYPDWAIKVAGGSFYKKKTGGK